MSIANRLAVRAATEYFIYDGTPSYDFRCLVFPRDIDSAQEKEYTPVSVPGRNGDILLSNKRFGNIIHSYDCIIYENFDINFANMRDFLLSRDGYCRLTDTFNPDEFYHAYFAESIQPTVWRDRSIGKFTLSFMRKPQRWLKSGDEWIQVYGSVNGSAASYWFNSGEVYNPTYNPSYPLLFLYGDTLSDNGFIPGLEISKDDNGTIITMVAPDNSTAQTRLNTCGMYIDMETLQAYSAPNAYSGSTVYDPYNVTNAVIMKKLGKNYFHQLAPGTTLFKQDRRVAGTYELTDVVKDIRVKPRWYRL